MSEQRSGWLEGRFSSRDAPGRPPTPAATVVASRDGPDGPEILFLRRGRRGAFGGMWVFPGGRVEPEDSAGAVAGPADPPGDPGVEVAVARRTAVREAAEEAGLLLAAERLVVHSFWLPPPEAPRRFATWFFLAAVSADAAVVVDRAEVSDHRWLTAEAAMAARDAGGLALAPPTYVTVWQLQGAATVEAALAEAASRPPRRFVTRVVAGGDRSALVWEGDSAWPDGDLAAPGARRRLWLSESGPWEAESPAEAS